MTQFLLEIIQLVKKLLGFWQSVKEGPDGKSGVIFLLAEVWGVRISRKFWSWTVGTNIAFLKAIVANFLTECQHN